jgi:hypothetical protein
MSNFYTDALAATLAVVGLMGTTPAWGESRAPQSDSVEEAVRVLIAHSAEIDRCTDDTAR